MNEKVKEYLVFDKLITPIVIQVIFWLSSATCVLFGLYVLFFVHEKESLYMGPLIIILGPLSVRIACEIYILIFKFYDAICALKK
jgi:hypothetical protein